jgi:FMN phosphatase YigB (HAD superfamily)
VELVRDHRLRQQGRTATALPRPDLRERWAMLAAEHLRLEIPAMPRWSVGSRSPTASFASLSERVLALAPPFPVVGFDLFNTLVVRRVEGEWLKTAVARYLAQRLGDILHPSQVPEPTQVRRRRSELEQAIASERVGAGLDNEVDFEELVVRWVSSWVPTEPYRSRLAADVRDRELALERMALRAAPGVGELLAGLKRLGKRVIFISDMYLAASVLRDLLGHCGIGDFFDAGYASIDHGLRKATGRLFPRVLELEGIERHQLLFVGDDANSDCAQPRKLGIAALHVWDAAEQHRRHRLQVAQWAAERNPFWTARYVEEVLWAAPTKVEQPADVAYRTGLVLAPALTAFVLDVIERSRQLRLDRLFFLAREGLTLLRIFDVLTRTEESERLPDVRYLFASRASTILPSMRELSWDEVCRFSRQYNRQSLRDLLRNLSLPAEEFLPLGAMCGITNPDRPILNAAEDRPLQRFLGARAVREAFTRHRDDARGRLARYLRRCGLLGNQRIGLVDVGWKGSMQDSLLRAFESDPSFPEVHGFYLALHHDGEPLPPRSFKYGYLADTRRNDLEESDVFRNTAIFEMATSASHGSTTGYGVSPWAPQVALPILAEHPLEKENHRRYFQRVQQAILEYAREFAQLRGLLPFKAEELKPGVLASLLRYTRYPTRDEADEFLRYSHVENFGVNEVTTFGFSLDRRALLGAKTPRGMLRELRRALEQNLWSEAVVRRTGIPLANVAYDAWYALQQAR